jgi:uncharacterized protein (DUF952 family)
MEGALLLNVIVRKRPSVLQLFSSKDQALLVGRDPTRLQISMRHLIRTSTANSPLLVLDLCLNIINSITQLDFESDGLSSKCLNEDLPAERKRNTNQN